MNIDTYIQIDKGIYVLMYVCAFVQAYMFIYKA